MAHGAYHAADLFVEETGAFNGVGQPVSTLVVSRLPLRLEDAAGRLKSVAGVFAQSGEAAEVVLAEEGGSASLEAVEM